MTKLEKIKAMRLFDESDAEVCTTHPLWRSTYKGEPCPACSYYENKDIFDNIFSKPEHNQLAPVRVTGVSDDILLNKGQKQ